jgi:outer membrane protein OmpA-like peptidoglycan-associated protein
MKNNIRRLWGVTAAALLIWSLAGLFGSGASAAEVTAAPAGDAGAKAAPGAAAPSVPPDEIQTLRQRIEAAETQIQLLKSVVIQALRAQSAAEEALQREREAQDVAPGAGPGESASRDVMIADHLEALTESLALLREDVAALRAEALGDRRPAGGAPRGDRESSALGVIEDSESGAPVDDPIADSGVGGAYDPLLEDESAALAGGDDLDGHIEVGLVYFDSGSASLSPGGERKVLEAADRIKAMEADRVRVVGFADRMGEAGYNLDLSTERAHSIATVLAFAGVPGEAVEIVGNGEDGVPVPTSDQVSEPLNRLGTIFVLMDSPK